MESVVRRARRLARRAYDSLYCRPIPGKVCLGTVDHWTVYRPALTRESIVYSAGVGKDITFERALAEGVGCAVELFDPSPTGVATMARPENAHPRLRFHALGIAGSSGPARFAPPANPDEGSYSRASAGAAGGVQMPCEDLPTLLARLGHARIDLLKLDIEGFEYGVVEQVCRLGLPVGQLCLEFHPALEPYPGATREALRSLARAGFERIHRERGDYTFARREIIRRGG